MGVPSIIPGSSGISKLVTKESDASIPPEKPPVSPVEPNLILENLVTGGNVSFQSLFGAIVSHRNVVSL